MNTGKSTTSKKSKTAGRPASKKPAAAKKRSASGRSAGKSTKRSTKNSRKQLIPVRIKWLLLVLAALAVIVYGIIAHQYSARYLEGTSINGVDVSHLTPDEAAEALRPSVENYSLTLHFRGDATEVIAGTSIDYSYTPGNEYETILKNQNPLLWIGGVFGVTEEYRTVTPVSFSAEKLSSLLSSLPEMQPENITSPVNARMQQDESLQFVIVSETEGNELNAESLQQAVEDAIQGKYTELDLTSAAGVYEEPAVRSDDESLNSAVSETNAFLATEVSFTYSDGSVIRTLAASTTENWLRADSETGFIVVDTEHLESNVRKYVADWAAADDNYGYFRVFRSTNYGNVKISTDALHGHELDQETIASQILQDLTEASGPVSHTITYSAYEDSRDPQLGGSYVEVDVDAQMVYVYQNYEMKLSSAVVTGNESTTPTPSGIYTIYYRETDAQLTGEMKSDGMPSYVANVSYWMAYSGGYGLHDATWRSSFGGSIYTYDGSHGCTNLPLDVAEQIWYLTDYDTPVVVFRASSGS